MFHYNVQIKIQAVSTEPVKAGEARGINQALSGKERQVVELLSLAVTAASEQEAHLKAHRLLSASEPPSEIATEVTHLHRASCDDAVGNHLCGYPDGPSIASKPEVVTEKIMQINRPGRG